MTVIFETGYTLPGTDMPLKHARMLHKGNRFYPATFTASDELSGYPGNSVLRGNTVDRWRPFESDLTASSNFTDGAWTLNELTVSDDGKTITETTANDTHTITQNYTFTAVEHVASILVDRQTIQNFGFNLTDGTSNFRGQFDLYAEAVTDETNATARIKKISETQFLCSIYFTPVAAAGNMQIRFADSGENFSYAGSTSNTIKIHHLSLHESEASLRMDLFDSAEGDIFAIAAHNLGTCGARITFEHDSNEDDTFTSLDSATLNDDSPIFYIFNSVDSSRWRITVDRGVLPEIGILWVGSALQFQRPFYSGFSIPSQNRQTELIGNLSGSGELLGRSRKRTVLAAEYSWNNLTYDWVRDNLDGPNGLIQAVETEGAFLAWRPGETQDVEYLMRPSVSSVPSAQGVRNLWDFALSGEAYSYE